MGHDRVFIILMAKLDIRDIQSALQKPATMLKTRNVAKY